MNRRLTIRSPENRRLGTRVRCSIDLDIYTNDDFWSTLLLRREVGCREVERLSLYLPRKVELHVESGIESFVGRMQEQKISCRSRELKYLPVHCSWQNLNTQSMAILAV